MRFLKDRVSQPHPLRFAQHLPQRGRLSEVDSLPLTVKFAQSASEVDSLPLAMKFAQSASEVDSLSLAVKLGLRGGDLRSLAPYWRKLHYPQDNFTYEVNFTCPYGQT